MMQKKTSTKSSKMFNHVIFYMTSIRNVQFLTFFGNLYFLVKSKMALKMTAILDDIAGPQQRGNP